MVTKDPSKTTDAPRNDGENHERASKTPMTRRAWIQATIGATLAAVALGRYEEETQRVDAAKEACTIFGPLNNPNYLVNTDLSFGPMPTLRETLERVSSEIALKFADPGKKIIERADIVVDRIARQVEERQGANKSANDLAPQPQNLALRLGSIYRMLSDLETKLLEHELNPLGDALSDTVDYANMSARHTTAQKSSFRELVQREGEPEPLVRRLVATLTGRELPLTITIAIRPIDEGSVIGLSNFVTQSILSEDGDYSIVVSTLAHEVGHLVATHDESRVATSDHARTANETQNWEEACAYAFQYAVDSYRAGTQSEYAVTIMDNAKLNHIGLLNKFYKLDSRECHAVGMAYFDAAMTVLGSPGAAFNYLASNTQLTPEMERVIVENRANMNTEDPRLQKLKQDILKVKNRIDAITA